MRGVLIRVGIPVASIAAALLVGAVVIALLGADPAAGYGALLRGAFGSPSALVATALKATPLLLVAVGITVSFRANVINVGGEGQMVLGAIASTAVAMAIPDVPRALAVPTVLLAGLLGGALWGLIPGFLKAYASVNEILSTIMLNIVAVQVMNFLLRGPMMDPVELELGSRIPQTARLPESTDLPLLGERLHAGVVVAVVAAVVVYVLLWRTPFGFRLRTVGLSTPAAAYAGMPVKRIVMSALTISGALAGLAGAVLVFGSESHRFVTDGSTAGFTGNAGFNGIVAALFGGLHPLASVPASFLFGGLLVGANAMQRAVQVPSALVQALNGLVVVFAVATGGWRNRLADRAELAEAAREAA